MPANYTKLDNPAWHALTETHANFSMGRPELKRYDPSILLFAGFEPGHAGILDQLDLVVNPLDFFFLFDRFPSPPDNYEVDWTIDYLQMVCDEPLPTEIRDNIELLGEANTKEMFDLVNMVFPGYYLPQTRQLGDYVGIFKDGHLVAMAGERMRMEGLTEISAVVTHPDHTGHGYAQQLMSWLHEKNNHAGIRHFLHTVTSNERAIRLYERLGYRKRRLIPVSKVTRIG